MMCRICTVPIPPRKHVDYADYTARTLQHEVDPTDQESSSLNYLDHEVEIDDLDHDVEIHNLDHQAEIDELL